MASRRVSPRGAERLQAKIDELGLTQAALSAKLGVSETAISRWLSGERRPSLGMALRLQKELDLDVEAWLAPTGTG